MKSGLMQDQRDQLERKLQLLLGTQNDWIAAYGAWCEEHEVSDTDAHDDHNIKLFVRHQKTAIEEATHARA